MPNRNGSSSRRRKSRVIAGAALAAGGMTMAGQALSLSGASASSASSASASHNCPSLSAGGNSYVVNVTTVSCSFAKKWVPSLAGKRLKANSTATKLSRGPAGYTCRAGTESQNEGFKADVQVSGVCTKGFGFSVPSFRWSIVLPGSNP